MYKEGFARTSRSIQERLAYAQRSNLIICQTPQRQQAIKGVFQIAGQVAIARQESTPIKILLNKIEACWCDQSKVEPGFLQSKQRHAHRQHIAGFNLLKRSKPNIFLEISEQLLLHLFTW